MAKEYACAKLGMTVEEFDASPKWNSETGTYEKKEIHSHPS